MARKKLLVCLLRLSGVTGSLVNGSYRFLYEQALDSIMKFRSKNSPAGIAFRLQVSKRGDWCFTASVSSGGSISPGRHIRSAVSIK